MKKKKYEFTEVIQQQVIEYSYFILDNKIKLDVLIEHEVSTALFLEVIFYYARLNYEEVGNYSIMPEDIEDIFKRLASYSKMISLLKEKRIDVVGVKNTNELIFNLTPEHELIYNKKTKNWEHKIDKVNE